MPAEAIAAFTLAGLWALAAATTRARPNLRLGSGFGWACWMLAAVAAAGGAGAVIADATWPATWLVAATSAAVVTSRLRAARRGATTTSSEGVSALVTIALGFGSAAAITVAAVVLHAAVEWPERLGLVALGSLAVVAALAAVVHVVAPQRPHLAIWLVGGLGATLALSGVAIALVHLLVGDVGSGELPGGEAFAGAVGAALFSLVLVPPLLLWVERRVSADRPNHRELLARIDDIVQRRLPLDETLLQTCELLRRGLGLQRVEAWTAGAEELTLVATDPHQPLRRVPVGANARRIAAGVAEAASGDWVETWLPGLLDQEAGEAATSAVSFGGEFRGMVVAYGDAVDDAVTAVFDDVAHRLGPVMHSASLDASLSESIEALRARELALRASRERLVAAADEERARIERDLHDGAQQHLVALSINLQLARGLIRTDPERAEELLAELAAVARTAVEELRSLSHGIFPKTLEDEGIGPALDETASSQRGVDVRVSSAGVERYPREIEAAVYFACNEAITNAVKHAQAVSVTVNLVGGDGELVFEVVDDGVGFDVGAAGAENGLTNMADRLGAVDGTISISSDGAGTRILGSVPLPGPDVYPFGV